MSILAGFFVPHPPIIVEEIGRNEIKKIQDTLNQYRLVSKEIAELNPQVIILSSPHAFAHYEYFQLSEGKQAQGSFVQFGHEELSYQVTYDEELVKKIESIANEKNFPAKSKGERNTLLDHGFLVPLSFIQKDNPKTSYIRVALSGLSSKEHYKMGQIIRQAVDELGRSAVFVASGDLSHTLKKDGPYGYRQEGEAFDNLVIKYLQESNIEGILSITNKTVESASQCGIDSLRMMLGSFDGDELDIKLRSYEKSFGVGYAIASFYPKTSHHQDVLVKLAKDTIQMYISEKRKYSIPPELPKEYTTQRKATFVSIHEHGQLRGCIGTLTPFASSLAQEVIDNAISACSRDPRFPPVGVHELKHLEISVDVLEEPEKITDISLLDPKKYGVIVSTGFRKGVLLPDLEGIDTIDEQLLIALRKAGISPKESYSIHRFTVTRHH